MEKVGPGGVLKPTFSMINSRGGPSTGVKIVTCPTARLAVLPRSRSATRPQALLCALPVPAFDGGLDVIVPPVVPVVPVVPGLAGADGHVRLDPVTVIAVHGVPVPSPERTFAHLTATWRLGDQVTLGDAAVPRST